MVNLQGVRGTWNAGAENFHSGRSIGRVVCVSAETGPFLSHLPECVYPYFLSHAWLEGRMSASLWGICHMLAIVSEQISLEEHSSAQVSLG